MKPSASVLSAASALAVVLGGAPARAASPAPTPRVGVMVAKAPSLRVRLAIPKALGVRYVRPNAVRLGNPTQAAPAALDATLRKGLFDPDGTLRPNGLAFRDFVRAHPEVR